jgi:hypothetical protein
MGEVELRYAGTDWRTVALLEECERGHEFVKLPNHPKNSLGNALCPHCCSARTEGSSALGWRPTEIGPDGYWHPCRDDSFLGKNPDGSFRYPEHEPRPNYEKLIERLRWLCDAKGREACGEAAEAISTLLKDGERERHQEAMNEECSSALKREFGYLPDEAGGEKWVVYQDRSLIVVHPDRRPRIYPRHGTGCNYYEIEPLP